jgi:predicted dehydrogenase
MALTLEDCDAMIEAAHRRGVKLGVGHHHNFAPVNVKAKDLIDSGKIGQIVMATDIWYKQFFDPAAGQRPDWFLKRECGGGIVWMNGPHLINRMMFFAGSDVVAVKATVGSPFHGHSAQDAAMALLHFANGVYATVISTGHKTGATRFEGEIIGTEGMLKVGSRLWVNNNEEKYEEISVEPYHTFDRQLTAFIQSIQDNTTPPVSGEYGRKVVQVMLACEESSRTGREVVLT